MSFDEKLGFQFQAADNRQVIMECRRIVAWRYEYLRKIEKLRSEGYLIVYIDETWFDSHDTTRKIWSDK